MGIRPDRMQALAWGLSAGAAGIAGALMATAYPWSPSVGETFGLIAFVVVAFGGFGSVLGSLYAGLIIGLIQAALGLLARCDLQGHRRLRLVRRAAVAAAARPDGEESVKSFSSPHVSVSLLAAALLLLSARFRRPVLSRYRRHVSAGGDLGVGVEHRRRLCRPGVGRPQHVLRARRLYAAVVLHSVGLAADRSAFRSASCWRSRSPSSSACRRSGSPDIISAWRPSRLPS